MRHDAMRRVLFVLCAAVVLSVARPAMAAFTLSGGGGGATPALSSVMAVGNTTDYNLSSTGRIETSDYFVLTGADVSYFATASHIPINMSGDGAGYTAAFLLEHKGTNIGLQLNNITGDSVNVMKLTASQMSGAGGPNKSVLYAENTSVGGEAARIYNTNLTNNQHTLGVQADTTSATAEALIGMAVSASNDQAYEELQRGSTDTAKVLSVDGFGVGWAVAMVNNTGATMNRGSVVQVASSTLAVGDFSFASTTASSPVPIGIVYGDQNENTACTDGEQCYIIISGIAEVLIDNGALANCTAGDVIRTSTTAGTAYPTTSFWPDTGGLIGVALETNTLGAEELCTVRLKL